MFRFHVLILLCLAFVMGAAQAKDITESGATLGKSPSHARAEIEISGLVSLGVEKGQGGYEVDTDRLRYLKSVDKAILVDLPINEHEVARFEIESIPLSSLPSIVLVDGEPINFGKTKTADSPLSQVDRKTFLGRSSSHTLILHIKGEELKYSCFETNGFTNHFARLDTHTQYSITRQNSIKPIICGFVDNAVALAPSISNQKEVPISVSAVPIRFDISNSLFTKAFNNQVQLAVDYVYELAAQSSAVLYRDTGLVLLVQEIHVWSSTEPFAVPGGNTLDKLQSYYDYLDSPGVYNNTISSHYLCSLDDLSGSNIGIATANNLCNAAAVEGVTGKRPDAESELFLHELGHNLGARHTNCHVPPIDCCHIESGCCSTEEEVLGTIMSGCSARKREYHPQSVEEMLFWLPNSGCVFARAPLLVIGTPYDVIFAGDSSDVPSQRYLLVNLSAEPISWTATRPLEDSWLSLSGECGSIAPFGYNELTLGLNASADLLASGIHNSTITFTSPGVPSTANIYIEVRKTAPGFSYLMDTDPGWERTGDWAFGPTLGVGTDPEAAATGSNVFGTNLAGDFSSASGEPETLTTPAFDFTQDSQVFISFQRFLTFNQSCRFELTIGGSAWLPIWEGSAYDFYDGGWRTVEYDVSAVAAGQSGVRFRWSLGPVSGGSADGGWSIDDVIITTPDGIDCEAGQLMRSTVIEDYDNSRFIEGIPMEERKAIVKGGGEGDEEEFLCPAESHFSQAIDNSESQTYGPSNYYLDLESESLSFDRFPGYAKPISKVVWWGTGAHFSGDNCTDINNNFSQPSHALD